MGSIPIPPHHFSFKAFQKMTEQEILAMYMAQSENVRELWKVKSSLSKDINHYVRKGDSYQVKIKTKLFSLLYSAWSETQFHQILFTPNGFTYSEIKYILSFKKNNGISQAWDLMLTNAMKRVGDSSRKGDLANRLQNLKKIKKKYISDPSELRNKIAHGEWINAINGKNTSVNIPASEALKKLDPVDIEKGFEIHRFFGYIVRDLVQSPKNSFHQRYWSNINNLEKYLKETEGWNLASKIESLNKKKTSDRLL